MDDDLTLLKTACKTCYEKSMALKTGEHVLIVSDEFSHSLGSTFRDTAEELGAKAELLEIKAMKVNGEEPSAQVAEAMKKADVVMIVASKSMTHTIASKKACHGGARIASMPGITPEMAIRTLGADYSKIRTRSKKLVGILNKGNFVKIKTKLGTDITLSIKGRKAKGLNEGYITEKGRLNNLPAGEAYISPIEGSAEGVYIVDTTNPLGKGKVDIPIKITVKKGYAVNITGGKSAKEMKDLLATLNKKECYNIAEIGIGTNDQATLNGNVLEDEKVLGTAHIAIGDNFSFGGKVIAPSHLDGIFKKPDIWIDDKKIMEEGRFLIKNF